MMDDELDHILNYIDVWTRNERFDIIDDILRSMNTDLQPTDKLLIYLVATLPAGSRLKTRNSFFERVKMTLIGRGETDPSLLYGLE